MKMRTPSVDEDALHNRLIDRWVIDGAHLIIVFGDGTWCLFEACNCTTFGVLTGIDDSALLDIPDARLRDLGILAPVESEKVKELERLRDFIEAEIKATKEKGL